LLVRYLECFYHWRKKHKKNEGQCCQGKNSQNEFEAVFEFFHKSKYYRCY